MGYLIDLIVKVRALPQKCRKKGREEQEKPEPAAGAGLRQRAARWREEGGLGHQPAGYVRAPGKWVYVAKKPVSCVTNKTSL